MIGLLVAAGIITVVVVHTVAWMLLDDLVHARRYRRERVGSDQASAAYS